MDISVAEEATEGFKMETGSLAKSDSDQQGGFLKRTISKVWPTNSESQTENRDSSCIIA